MAERIKKNTILSTLSQLLSFVFVVIYWNVKGKKTVG